MKRFFAGTAVVLAVVLFLSLPVGAISAQKAILLDAQTGRVLYEKDADSRSLIAGTTKIMTALVVLEVMRPDTVVKVPAAAVGIEGSSVYLFVDESRAFALRSDDKVVVRRSKYVTKLVRLTERSFCEIFAQKMLPGGWNHEK